MLLQIVAPTTAFALTGGASQPEVNSFTPIGTSDMVDPFSGGFNYNIPLMDVGGHPINISYNGAPTMDQEATMVGLGWGLNAAGQINRSLRGIPDDFKGGADKVIQENNMRKNWTFGMGVAVSGEAFGFPLGNVGVNLGANYNNYNGVSISSGASLSLNLTKGSTSGGLGLSATNSSSGGLSLSPSLSFNQKFKNTKNIDNSFSTGLSIGATFNSRQGLSSVSVSASASGVSKEEVAAMTRQEGDKEGKGGLTGRGLSGSVSISMMNNTYVPNLDLPRTTSSLSGSFKLGFEIFGADADAVFNGYYTEQKLATKVRSFPAYGTAYEEYGVGNSNAMLDFNREKQRAFSRNVPDLHTTNHTYDLFSISGQGVGGMFRTFRSEVGYVHDNQVKDKSTGGKANFEAAPGNLFGVGFSGGVTYTEGASGNWRNDNAAKGKLSHQKKKTNNTYEPFYFKHTGEITVDDEMQEKSSSLFSRSGGFDPVRLGVYSSGFTHRVQPVYQGKALGDINAIADNKRADNTRAKRNQMITTLTNSEARDFGIEHQQPHQNRTDRDHHFSEMTVLQNNGARHVYGIPAYNTLKKDVSFNASKGIPTATQMIAYTAGIDNSTENKRGRDHYFSRTTLPPYAHSYLLTAVLSHDYVDRKNDGVTKDDYGSFTKFNYGETAAIPNYKWRVPYNKEEANYSEGLKTDPGDDKGNYVYGEKELWYLDNIETKTHIAVFQMSNRRDGYGVVDENGGLGGDPMQKLDKISLYARPDFYLVDGVTPNPNKTPIKEVHFVYDYSLCQGIPNHKPAPNSADNQKGKLTLKRVYFTYANSYKGALSDYQFVYADPNHDGTMEANYPYDLKAVNAWGGYQAQVSDAGFGVDKGLLNSEYPYVDQTPDLSQDPENYFKKQTQYVNAWALTSVKLPSGGRIDVDLEPHEYAYVQDQEALQMYTVLGCNNSGNDYRTAKGKLYGGAGNLNPNNYIHLVVPKRTTKAQLFKNLLNGKPLYYRFLVDLTNGLDADNGSYEYVEGYLSKELIDRDSNGNGVVDANDDDGCGVNVNDDGSTTAWIRIKSVPTNNEGGALNPRNSHPIAKSAWQFARMYAPKKAFDQPDPQNGASLIDIAKLLASQVTNMVELFTGANGLLRTKGYGKAFNPNKSWIRLNTPNQHKLGGGCRVAAIKMYDNWELMSEKSDDNLDGFDHDFEYGQTYKYTLEDGVSSSGVATYEPLGAKDNPLIQPVYFSEEHLLAPDGKHYMEKPYGESFYPGPSIGYSRVEVANLSREDVKKHATGKMVHEFYTCRDYPVKVANTGLFSRERRSNILGQILKISSRNYAVASQGFVIETNDMNGKQKAQRVYAEGQIDPIAGTKYVYDHNFSDVAPNSNADLFPSLNTNSTKLNNNVNVITPQGKLETKQIGVDFDMINDFGENSTMMVDINIDANLATFIVGIFPGFVPTVLPRVATEKTRYRYAATTKVINRFGILREVIAYDLGAAVSTRNKAWDSETGEVLLTETTNEYGDKVFNFNYPAHWYYKGMGQAYQNIGMQVKFTATGGIISAAAPPGETLSAYHHLYPGDEIASGSTKYWIEDDGAGLKVIDADGYPKSGVISGKIIRSGHRNRQALSIGNVTMLNDPLADANGSAYPKGTRLPLLKRTSTLNEEAVVNTSINEFSEDWIQNYCNCDLDITTTYNPYVENAKGTWRLKKAHLYLVGRKQTAIKNAREEGVYSRYNTFWRIPGSKWVKNNQNYTWSSQVSKYSPYGFELENQDSLGRNSAAQYDYNNNLPTAVANNARYSDIGFDGFEEYDFDECTNDHFSFENSINGSYTIDSETSHTGRRSFKLNPGESATLEKDLLNCSPVRAAY
jgi:hypothetical protein